VVLSVSLYIEIVPIASEMRNREFLYLTESTLHLW
jgi:hypothetical protein